MWLSLIKQGYQAVARDVEDDDDGLTQVPGNRKSPWRSVWTYTVGLFVLLLAALAVMAFVLLPRETYHLEDIRPGASTATELASHCAPRREWRSLEMHEQQAYIAAVKCLQTSPSRIFKDERATAYDDFPWIHSHVGYTTHNSAPFLPWHRYLLHAYHQRLRKECSYTGELVYWDWTLDSKALERSPIFDSAAGFGGDGDVSGNITVGRTGRCVVDGPFANTEVSFYDVKHQPHCLSRGFRDEEGHLGHMDGHDVSPESIEEVLSLGDYESFVAIMESKIHDTIPFGIAGDFETFTAPYDPIFFLHHTQLDRLWYLWQQRQPGQGLEAYGGHKGRHSLTIASLDDELDYRKLAPNVRVKDVMDIGNDLLCYGY